MFDDQNLKVNSVFQGRQKADKNRQKSQEAFLKTAHSQRQEAAQLRKEEKRRQEKERIMNEEDPDKARKLEVRSMLMVIIMWPTVTPKHQLIF